MFIEMGEALRNVEIRKLPYGSLTRIIDILEIDHDWKKLMSKIPKHPQNTYFEPKYNNEHISLIENDSHFSSRKCSAILFEEWGTSGRIRPTLLTLKDILLKCKMYRAADEVAFLLKEAPPSRPMDGPAAPIDTDVTLLLNNETTNVMDSNKGHQSVNTYDHMNNKTTAQMKSASDLIKFSQNCTETPNMSKFTPDKKGAADSNLIKFSQTSNSIASGDLPNLSALTPTGNQETDPMKLDVNTSASQNSFNISDMPIISALMGQIKVSTNTTLSNTGSDTLQSTSEISDSSDILTPSLVSQDIQTPSVYQQSFPNIILSENLSINIDNEIFENSNLINFKYEELKQMTNNFSEQLIVEDNSIRGKIGVGGFGEVFVAIHPNLKALAIKKAHDDLPNYRKSDLTTRLFNAEVRFLSQFKHENIVPILGYSRDGPAPCIVCEFIEGGSLEHNIAAKVLSEKHRIDIMTGTAEGLKYLHKSNSYDTTSESQSGKRTNFVHGDVKSANILLTRDYVPKLCDFGLAKQYNDTFVTTSPMGTSAYMAPEGLSGTITQKVDIYSYGIVLLELITGLKSIVHTDNEQINIKDFVEEHCENKDVSNLFDSVVDNWTKANEIFDLAKGCLERNRKKRLAIEDVCEKLNRIRI